LVGREPLPEGGCGRLAIEGGHLDLAAVSGAVSVGRRLSYCTIQVGRNEVVIGRDRGFNRIRSSRAVIRRSGQADFLVGRFPRTTRPTVVLEFLASAPDATCSISPPTVVSRALRDPSRADTSLRGAASERPNQPVKLKVLLGVRFQPEV
jgi:hypothetical protein